MNLYLWIHIKMYIIPSCHVYSLSRFYFVKCYFAEAVKRAEIKTILFLGWLMLS